MLNGETKSSQLHGKKPAEGKSKKKRGGGAKDKSRLTSQVPECGQEGTTSRGSRLVSAKGFFRSQ